MDNLQADLDRIEEEIINELEANNEEDDSNDNSDSGGSSGDLHNSDLDGEHESH